MIDIIVDSRIRFNSDGIGLTGKDGQQWLRFLGEVKQDMMLNNPVYEEAVRYGRYVGYIPSRIVLDEYDQATHMASLPRGYMGHLLALLKRYGFEYQVIDNRVQLPSVEFTSAIELRIYQAPAIDSLLRGTQGILEAPAGAGKTECGMEIMARVGQPALWLTHTQDLAEQAAARAVRCLGIPRGEIGMIGCGKEQIGERLTIGIIQKLVRMETTDLAGVLGRFGLVIIDEIHHANSASTWQAVINQIPAKWRYGVTATLKRGDHLETVTHQTIGPTLAKIERSEVESVGKVVVPGLRVIKTECASATWTAYQERVAKWNETCKQCKLQGRPEPKKLMLPYGKILEDVLGDDGRNCLIINTLLQECPGHYSLVLSERVNHCEVLAELLKACLGSLRTAVIHGKMNKTDRKTVISAMDAGELDILFAVDIAKEGLDIPRLDRLFIVGGGRNEAEVEQKVGRIQRSFAGKMDAVVFDFVDPEIGVLANQYWTRNRVYKNLGMVRGKTTRREAS